MQDAADSAATPRTVTVSITDLYLLAFGSAVGGAIAGGLIGFLLTRLLGWHPAVSRGIGFFFVWVSLYAPLKVWNEARGRRPGSTGRYLLAAVVASVAIGVLNVLMP